MVSVTRSGVGIKQYVYNPRGERVWQRLYKTGWSYWQERDFFWGAEGNHLLTEFGISTYKNVYFGGRQVYRSYIGSTGTVIQDRLGSAVRQYFPYGDEPTTTTQNRVKFATYFRDEVSTLDYARNRYYSSTIARFTTADPYGGSARPGAPQTWNRYSYVGGDPVNRNDPSGLDYFIPDPTDFNPGDPRNVDGTSLTVSATADDVSLVAHPPAGILSGAPIPYISPWGFTAISEGERSDRVKHACADTPLNPDAQYVLELVAHLTGGLTSGTTWAGFFAASCTLGAAGLGVVEGLVTYGPLIDSALAAASPGFAEALQYARIPNNMSHIFNDAGHALSALASQLGGDAVVIEQALTQVYRLQLANGTYTAGVQVSVGGTTLIVRGVMIDGVFKIGTMFVPLP